ncbi:NADH dehydrogenase [ubiquinone] 1 beta subcomplex subunit 3 [Copidosoma floridanum]|uniref:NADH dehydrogenase [ubiquinone] 1 beta subcomplex subunit 3 n=1 Tax=Copidosoma floridanum TaxID=29053 RepID=UPI0006C98A0D|nr:NADH dehydrogenase [ubiquinone] 1 beta subcomplex subunit 3 [Copidosoma floridanum]XP_014212207.1 NADH dehydrogenase [ubiquinone] 1 beta subcomplex subunit 3 [Copidosoma floridanum]
MGGHHKPHIPEVPDASKFKVESSEFLMDIQKKLGEKGLKDPWLRNHVWRTDQWKGKKHPDWVLLRIFTYGWKIWVPLVIGTIAVESFLGIDYHGHSNHGDHGNGDGHGDKH